MKKSWMITVRMISPRTRGSAKQEGNDVAFALFHHEHEKTVVEMVCVANGKDSTPKREQVDESHLKCGLQELLIRLIQCLLVRSFARTTHIIAALVPSGEEPLDSIYGHLFQGCEVCKGPASTTVWFNHLYKKHWAEEGECTEYSQKIGVRAMTSARWTASICPTPKRPGSLVTDLYEKPCALPESQHADGGNIETGSTDAERRDMKNKETDANIEEEQLDVRGQLSTKRDESFLQDQSDTGQTAWMEDGSDMEVKENDYDMDGQMEEDSNAPDSLQDQVERIYNEVEEGDNGDLTDQQFANIRKEYGEESNLPQGRALPELHGAIDAQISITLDIDSGLVHGPTPFKTASAFNPYNNCYIDIKSPNRWHRNKLGTRLHVKKGQDFHPKNKKDGSCPKKLDMADFPNFEVGTLYVSNYHIRFTMYLHLIQENLSTLCDQINIGAWNAALNSAKNNYEDTLAFKECTDGSIKEDLVTRLNDTCDFELVDDKKAKKGTAPTIRFKYKTGCLFFKIVWEKLQNFGLGVEEALGKEHRMGDWLHCGNHQKEEIQKAAEDLYNYSHTVVQAAGYRHHYRPYKTSNDGRPPFSEQRAFHQWLNAEYQEYMKAAVRNLFVDAVHPDVRIFLDLGMNFKSEKEEFFVMINGYKAERILKGQIKVLSQVARAYYSDETGLPREGEERMRGDSEDSGEPRGEALVGKCIRTVRNL